jgi:ABC-type multidrug transport system permease subunit
MRPGLVGREIVDGGSSSYLSSGCPVTNETTTLLINTVPLLVAAALYLALSALLFRSLLGAGRRPTTSGFALWLLFTVAGVTTAILGVAKLGYSEPLASSRPCPAYA